MERRKRKTAARPRVNRILGFAGDPTDDEIDEVITLWMRMVLRLVTSGQFVTVMRSVQRFGGAFGGAFGGGDA